MTSVERVKLICKGRKIAISKLEKDLGYGNGYIGQLKKGVLPDDRLHQIANYLNVSSSFLSTGIEEDKKIPATESDGFAKPYSNPEDELTEYAVSIFNQLSIEHRVQAINELKLLLLQEADHGGLQEDE